ncbi:MAG: helix-turn-helix domain-containing protein [Treponema sp.]|jgi:transcriptional regulator with XRE-family HTH domain|nr:helix-turn-helix domain-containing protein [Treponema sp.]
MNGIKERIKEIRTRLNISQRDFSQRIFISQTLLGEIELGNRTVTDRTIQLISTEFNLNKDWILTGQGDMFTAPPPDIQLENLIEIYKQLDVVLRNYLLEQSKSLLKLQKEKFDI